MNDLAMCRESRSYMLRDPYGLHVRTAGLFAQSVSRFAADVQVEVNGLIASGTSILELLMLGAACGSTLRVTAVGQQAKEVLDTLADLMG